MPSNTSNSDASMRANSPSGPPQRYHPVAMELDGPTVDAVVANEAVGSQSSSAATMTRLVTCFWILGLLNNASYVIMIACAKSISEGGTALVFLANIVPSLAVKATAPYWFDKVHYRTRLQAATICMMTSFILVAGTSARAAAALNQVDKDHPAPASITGEAVGTGIDANLSSKTPSTTMTHLLLIQLLGVSFGSAQCGLGEASLLALAGKVDGAASGSEHDKGRCLTSFSSGTGMAGVFGFFWKWVWNDCVGLSMSTTVWLAMILAVGYWWSFQYAQRQQESLERETGDDEDVLDTTEKLSDEEELPNETQALAPSSTDSGRPIVTPIPEMTPRERFQLVLSLWPYMIPLFVVYAAEYALQSGTWTAIGFPLENMEARDRFYEFSNWAYQAGVFVSRSSGTLFTAPMSLLWLMPALQFANLGLYTYVASHPNFSAVYRPGVLYGGALYTGLLGGAVYIHGYKRICLDLPVAHREFSLSATSVAEGIGVLVADAVGLVIESCLYKVNKLEGALFSCPIR